MSDSQHRYRRSLSEATEDDAMEIGKRLGNAIEKLKELAGDDGGFVEVEDMLKMAEGYKLTVDQLVEEKRNGMGVRQVSFTSLNEMWINRMGVSQSSFEFNPEYFQRQDRQIPTEVVTDLQGDLQRIRQATPSNSEIAKRLTVSAVVRAVIKVGEHLLIDPMVRPENHIADQPDHVDIENLDDHSITRLSGIGDPFIGLSSSNKSDANEIRANIQGSNHWVLLKTIKSFPGLSLIEVERLGLRRGLGNALPEALGQCIAGCYRNKWSRMPLVITNGQEYIFNIYEEDRSPSDGTVTNRRYYEALPIDIISEGEVSIEKLTMLLQIMTAWTSVVPSMEGEAGWAVGLHEKSSVMSRYSSGWTHPGDPGNAA